MIFANSVGSRSAQAIGQIPNGLAPTTMRVAPQPGPAFVMPEDRVRVAIETICMMRKDGRTEAEIVAYLRQTIGGITDVQISEAMMAANAACPAQVGPITPPPPEIQIAPPPPVPIVPDEPTIVLLPPAPTGTTKKWLVLGGVAAGIVGLGVLAWYFSR